MPNAQRTRFPDGYNGYRQHLGGILKSRRIELRMTQQKLADAVGIARTGLSAIENGRSWPHWETMDELVEQLHLNFHDVFEVCTGKTPQYDDEDSNADHLLDLGAYLRAGRKSQQLKLWQVAEKCQLQADRYNSLSRQFNSLAMTDKVSAKRYKRLAKKCAQVGKRRKVSVAQLSRIERGVVTRSRVYQSRMGLIQFVHPVLGALARASYNEKAQGTA